MTTSDTDRALRRLLRACAILVFLASRGTAVFAGPLYSVSGLGTLPNGVSYQADAINNAGQVVGTYDNGGSPGFFLYATGTMTQVPNPGGPTNIGISINDSGQIGPVGINDSGQTVSNNNQGGVFFNGTTTIDLGPSTLMGLNNEGQAVGKLVTLDGTDVVGHPFLYSNGQITQIPLLPGATNAAADAINDHGQVVGGAANAPSPAFLYSAGKLTDLGSLGGPYAAALAINNNGLIVGYSETLLQNYVGHAFLYANGTMTDLNTLIPASSGWVLNAALGVNEAGQIVGYGTFDGQTRAFLLNPNPTPVPEPATLWAFAAGGLAYGVRQLSRQRRQRGVC